MNKDLQGHLVTGASAAALVDFHGAIAAFNLYRGDPLALLDQALAAAPDFAMARIGKILMLALSTEPMATVQARELAEPLTSLKMNDREKSHSAAAQALLAGDWRGAARRFDLHSIEYPLDMLALQAGHLVDFYCADSRNLRERIARALPQWDESTPGFSVVLGMYAFGLEEDGHYGRAEDAGRRALALEPFDCWAHHAVAHVMEMQGRPEDGIGWMIAREPFWNADDNFFRVHNWWHRAVFHLDLGQKEEALALYDGPVREGKSAVALDLIDASALLWRLQLAGVEVGGRWRELAGVWQLHGDGQTYPFNDWHAAMAYLGAGEDALLGELVSAMEAAGRHSPIGDWCTGIGLPLIAGFTHFQRGEFEQAAATLMPVRRFAGRFGGSHAQRDIIDLTATEAACRGGLACVARALSNERLSVRPHSNMAREFLRRAAKKSARNPAVVALDLAPSMAAVSH